MLVGFLFFVNQFDYFIGYLLGNRVMIGENAVVMGAGLVGLLTLQLAARAGARPLVSVDLSPARLELAARIGADYTINPNTEDLADRVRSVLGGEGADCTIEAVGNPAVLCPILTSVDTYT